MNNFELAAALQKLSYSFIPVLLGIILHEVAHGYVAYKKGDPTAMMFGRITLNPLPHIDPVGLIVLFLRRCSVLLFLAGPSRFRSIPVILKISAGI